MAKTVAVRKKSIAPEKKTEPLIPEKYQDWVYMFFILLSVFIFLGSAIFGPGFKDFDFISSASFKPYLHKASQSGQYPLWIPYIFSGMPSFASLLIAGVRGWDIISTIFFEITAFVGSLFGNDVARMSCFYGIYGIGVYLLMRSKKHDRMVAFFSALAAVYSTWVITWVMIGHNTKPVVLSMFPFIFLFMEKLRIKFSLGYAVLLIIAVHLMMEAGHLQMIFYGGCAFGLYLLFEFISRLIKKEAPVKVLRAAGMLVIAGGLAFVMSADRYLSTMEYTPYSTRGSAPITKTKTQSQDVKGGNDYQYATMWSYSPAELFTFVNPSYYGSGMRKYQEHLAPTYWGQKESEDSPPYMGIGVLALAILGLILFRKDVFVQFLFVLSLFAIFLSFGKNMPVLYDVFFNYIPSFNKFRAPSMSLALLHFSVPIMAGYGLTGILKWRKNLEPGDKKKLNALMIISAGLLVIGVLINIGFKGSYVSAVEHSNYIKQINSAYGEGVGTELTSFIWSEMISDWYITALILIGFAAMIYLYVKGTVGKMIFFSAIIALLIIDLWRVDYRRMDVPEEKESTDVFTEKEDVFNYIKQDKSVFRIADFASNPANISAYFLVENINGYHSAKMRVYQDLLDVANPDAYQGSTSQLFNPFLWNLMNVRYIITNRQLGNVQPIYSSERAQSLVYANPSALPRAFFVKNAAVAKQMDILLHLKNGDFNPVDTAFIEAALPEKIDTNTTGATAEVTSHENEYVKIEANATGNNLLFISEIYYPVSWHAFIDGKEAPIYKTNYAFRSIVVPKGKHTIEMKFTSPKFELGKNLSIAGNILVALAGLGSLFFVWKKKKEKTETVEETEE